MRAQPNKSTNREIELSRRRCLKRVAYSLGAILVASALFSASGCKTTSSSEKESKTIDDFLSAEKPGW